ncbi:MAG: DUF6268 family outer membrane beta-barrel protein [Bacteroidota bacterium]|nr:DUF6268 family outer membrane beta-barrel protein [Bacteroidota bacterium]
MTTAKKVNGTDKLFALNTTLLAATIPVGDAQFNPQNTISLVQPYFHLQTSYHPAVTEFLNNRHNLFSGSVAFSLLLITNAKNFYWLSLGSSIAEDEHTIHNAQPRISAFGLGSYQTGEDFKLLYGGAITYQFEKGLFLPIVGFKWKTGEKGRFQTILPFSLVLETIENDGIKVKYVLTLDGDRFRMENDGSFSNVSKFIYMRATNILAGVGCVVPDGNFEYAFQLGVLMARQVYVYSGDNVVLDATVRPSLRVSLGCKYNIGTSPFAKIGEVE